MTSIPSIESETPAAEVFAGRFEQFLNRDEVVVLLLADLEELYVRPELRDRGIGTKALHEAIRHALAVGCCEFSIGVDEVDGDTRRFYERHGFSNFETGTDTRMLLYQREL